MQPNPFAKAWRPPSKRQPLPSRIAAALVAVTANHETCRHRYPRAHLAFVATDQARACSETVFACGRPRQRARFDSGNCARRAYALARSRPPRRRPAEIEALVTSHNGFDILPIDLAQTQAFVGLGGLRDPFDRMIIAAARSGPYPLLSADNLIAASKLVDVERD